MTNRLKQAWQALCGTLGLRRGVRVVTHPPGPSWPVGLGDNDITESGYTFAELEGIAKGERRNGE